MRIAVSPNISAPPRDLFASAVETELRRGDTKIRRNSAHKAKNANPFVFSILAITGLFSRFYLDYERLTRCKQHTY